MGKYSCFLICPISEAGTQTREYADVLLEELQTALSPLGFEVTRGDHHLTEARIDDDVVRSVQEADLCVADMSEENVNVYYEVGRRDETGKPIVLFKRQGTGKLATDIVGRRCEEYELDTRRGAHEFREKVVSMVEPLVECGFEGRRAATLSEVVTILQRVERKIDAVKKGTGGHSVMPSEVRPDDNGQAKGLSPQEMFAVGIKMEDMSMIEGALDRLRGIVDNIVFYDNFVSIAAVKGSSKAGKMLVDHARAFFDDAQVTGRMKTEYLGCLISFLNRTDAEEEQRELVESLASELLACDDLELKERGNVHNQLNRLYYGMFVTGGRKDIELMHRAASELKQALDCDEHPSFHYNLAMIHDELGEGEEAANEISRCLEMTADDPDTDHLLLACRIYRKMDDVRFDEAFEQLRTLNPFKAMLV